MTQIARNQARVMLDLQARMNSKVESEWIAARFPYLRAVVVEGAEAIEHHGWKWWKKQERDLPQLQMELVDIWHFLLSELLLRDDGDHDRAADALLQVNTDTRTSILFDGNDYDLAQLGLVRRLELLIGLATVRRIELALFRSIMLDCHMDWDTLFRQYVSKNVLNFFRQDHGYKEGTYLKLWNGKEDNEHLVEVMALLDAEDPAYPDRLYQQLAQRYPG